MSSQRRETSRSTAQRKQLVPQSATTMKNIAYLMRNSPKKLTEREAKLFLTELQRKYPRETINVTKTGKIFSVGKTGTITHIGIDGRPIRPVLKVARHIDLPKEKKVIKPPMRASITAAEKPRYRPPKQIEKPDRSILQSLTERVGKSRRSSLHTLTDRIGKSKRKKEE